MASGIEALLDALKQSGVDVDEFGGGRGNGREREDPIDVSDDSSDDTGGSKDGGGFRGGGRIPHVEFSGSLGDRMAAWSRRTLTLAIVLAIIILLAA